MPPVTIHSPGTELLPKAIRQNNSFQAFCRPQAALDSNFGQTATLQATPISALPAVEDPFMLQGSLSPRKLTGLFLSGFVAAFAGQMVWRQAFGSKQALTEQVAQTVHPSSITTGGLRQDEVNIWLLMQEKLTSMVGLAIHEPEQRKTLVAYGASSLVGYVMGNVMQGTQETWVRREESLIRAKLLNRLTGTVQQSIRQKHQQDEQLREEAIRRIGQLLYQNRLSPAMLLQQVSTSPVEPLAQQNHQLFEPTHRTVTPMRFGRQEEGFEAGANGFRAPETRKNAHLPEALALGAGGVCGWLCHQFLSVLGKAHQALNTQPNGEAVAKKIVQTINVPNEEALFVLGWNRHKSLILAVMGLGAAVKVGKLWLDGLREIEVTKVNADTEYRYQHHNWITLDPRFHQIAEEEALAHELKLFSQEIPFLKQNPPALRQRIQTILTNIGRNSAPKYFPMIPMVGLREARS